MLALAATRERTREVRVAADDQPAMAAELLGQSFGHERFTAVERHARLELAVGELRQLLYGPRDAGVALDVIIPGRDVPVANWPIDGDAILHVALEILLAPAIALASPHERTTADLIAAVPI